MSIIHSGVYIIKNIKNGKVYVGSTNNLDRRLREHKKYLDNNKHHSYKLQKSYNKYGSDSFEFTIIQYCLNETLIENEQYWINKFNSYKDGYNCTKLAGSTLGMTGKKLTDEHKEALRRANIGKKMSDETKEKVSKAKKGQKPWNKGMKGIAKSNKGSFKKGQTPWNKGMKGLEIGWKKGKKRSKETIEKMRTSKFDLNKIFELNQIGISQRKIALIIGCSQSNISRILKNRTNGD